MVEFILLFVIVIYKTKVYRVKLHLLRDIVLPWRRV